MVLDFTFITMLLLSLHPSFLEVNSIIVVILSQL